MPSQPSLQPSLNAPTWASSFISTCGPSGRALIASMNTASEILPRVYLADLDTACDETKLAALGITHVISVIEEAPRFPPTRSLRTLHIPLSDSAKENILPYLPTTTSFIFDALAESPDSRVLVHCLVGRSRSPTVVCAYLVATARMTPEEALDAVREKRRLAKPNVGFLDQLDEYAYGLSIS